MNEALIILSLVKMGVDALQAQKAGTATDEQLDLLRKASELKVDDAKASIDAALAKQGIQPPQT